MARLNTASERFNLLTAIDLYVIQSGTIGDTTTTAPLARAASSVPVTASTNFTNGDPVFIIGDGGMELNAINGAPNTTMTMARKIELAQSTGARFVEAVKVPLGYPNEQGISFTGSLQNTPVNSAISRLPIGFIPGNAELSLNFGLLGWNVENLQLMFGAPELVSGTGTSADPTQGSVVGTNVAAAVNRVLRCTGSRADGKTWEIDFLNFQHTISGSVTLGRDVAAYPISGTCDGIIKRVWT